MDHIASRDQARAYLEHSRGTIVSGKAHVETSAERIARVADRRKRTVERLALSRVKLSLASRAVRTSV